MVSKHELTGTSHLSSIPCYGGGKLLILLACQIKRQSLTSYSVMTILNSVSDVIFFHHCAMFFIVLSCIFVSPLFTSEVMTHTKWAATWYHLMHISYSLRQNHFVDIVSVQICYLAIVCKFVHTYIIYIFDFSVLPGSFSTEHFSYLTCLWKVSITYTLLRHSMSMSWKFW